MELILKDITVIFGFSTIVLMLLAKIRIPAILGYLITGLLIGPNGLGFISNPENVHNMAEIGVILLLFSIGLEFSTKQLMELKRPALGGGTLQVVLTTLFVTLVCMVSGLDFATSIFIGMIIAPSSTAIVLKLLGDKGESDSPYGRIVTSILIFQDIAVIPMMLIVPMLSPEGESSLLTIGLTMGKALIVVILLFMIAKFIVPFLLKRVVRTRSREVFIFSIILICIAVAFITNQQGLSLALGAFLAGMIVSETGFGYQALGNVTPFKEVFTGFFFINIGMMIKFGIFLDNPLLIIFLALIIILVKMLVVLSSISLLGYSLETGLKTGLALAQVGEFSFILATSGLGAGLITEDQNTLFITIAVISMAATPFLIQSAPLFLKILNKFKLPEHIVKGYFHEKKEAKKIYNDHIIVVGYGLAGRLAVEAADSANIDTIIIEMNPTTVEREKKNGRAIFYGDASQEEILEHASIGKARAIVISSADVSTAKNMIETAKRLNPTLIVAARTRFKSQIDELKKLGADEVIAEEVEASISLLRALFKHYYLSPEKIQEIGDKITQVDLSSATKQILEAKNSYKLGYKGLSIETVTVPVGAQVTGESIRAIDPRFKYNVNILAKKSGDTVTVSPGPNDRLNDRDELIVSGTMNDIQIFSSFINTKK